MLKQGMLGPHEECSYLAVKDAKFVGLQVGDFPEYEGLLKPWKSHWALRLKYMKRYNCFRSAEWRREFKAFENQHAALRSGDTIPIPAESDHVPRSPNNIGCKFEYSKPCTTPYHLT
jgi:hypothetical protein